MLVSYKEQFPLIFHNVIHLYFHVNLDRCTVHVDISHKPKTTNNSYLSFCNECNGPKEKDIIYTKHSGNSKTIFDFDSFQQQLQGKQLY